MKNSDVLKDKDNILVHPTRVKTSNYICPDCASKNEFFYNAAKRPIWGSVMVDGKFILHLVDPQDFIKICDD